MIRMILVLALALGSPAPAKWKYELVKDPMNDSSRSVLSLSAEAAIDGKTPELVIRCPHPDTKKDVWGKKHVVGGNAEVYVVTGWPVHGGYAHALRVRLDDQKPITDRWIDAEDLGAVFHDTLTVKGQVQFIQRVAAAHKMLFEFTPYMGTPKVAEFDVTGLDTLLPKMYEVCEWPK